MSYDVAGQADRAVAQSGGTREGVIRELAAFFADAEKVAGPINADVLPELTLASFIRVGIGEAPDTATMLALKRLVTLCVEHEVTWDDVGRGSA